MFKKLTRGLTKEYAQVPKEEGVRSESYSFDQRNRKILGWKISEAEAPEELGEPFETVLTNTRTSQFPGARWGGAGAGTCKQKPHNPQKRPCGVD